MAPSKVEIGKLTSTKVEYVAYLLNGSGYFKLNTPNIELQLSWLECVSNEHFSSNPAYQKLKMAMMEDFRNLAKNNFNSSYHI